MEDENIKTKEKNKTAWIGFLIFINVTFWIIFLIIYIESQYSVLVYRPPNPPVIPTSGKILTYSAWESLSRIALYAALSTAALIAVKGYTRKK